MIPEELRTELIVDAQKAQEMYPKMLEFLEKLEYMTLDRDMSQAIRHFMKENNIW